MPRPIRSTVLAWDIRNLRATRKGQPGGRPVMSSVAREPVSLLREILGQAILVISGQSRMMYQNLVPKPKGTIFSKRSKPQGLPELLTTQPPLWRPNRTYEVS